MGDLERIIQQEADDLRKKKERIKEFAMSFSSRVKPFFVELRFMEDSIIGLRKRARGMINGSLIESFQPINESRPEKGTQINFVFGERQFVCESVSEVRKALEDAINDHY